MVPLGRCLRIVGRARRICGEEFHRGGIGDWGDTHEVGQLGCVQVEDGHGDGHEIVAKNQKGQDGVGEGVYGEAAVVA